MALPMRPFLLPLLLLFALLAAGGAQDPPSRRGPVKLTDEALRLHREAFVFDGHNDLPWALREKSDPAFRRHDIARNANRNGKSTC